MKTAASPKQEAFFFCWLFSGCYVWKPPFSFLVPGSWFWGRWRDTTRGKVQKGWEKKPFNLLLGQVVFSPKQLQQVQ